VLINRYQTFTGGGPIMLNSGTPLNGLIRLGISDLLEDIRINGGFKISTDLKNNEWYVNYENLKRRIDWGGSYYRNSETFSANGGYLVKVFTNLYQANISYPFDETKRIRFSTGIRSEKQVLSSLDGFSLSEPNQKILYNVNRLEYVYDNSLNPATNIYNGLRYKFSIDWNRQVSGVKFSDGPNTFNFGVDARYYYPIYRNFIWAGRAAADFSWGNQKFIYYLGGVDGWLMFGDNTVIRNGEQKDRYFNTNNPAAALQQGADLPYACKGGVCCTCRAKLVSGEVSMDVNYALEPEEVEQGFILTCQSHPRSENVVVDFDIK
jgi:ferredoxin